MIMSKVEVGDWIPISLTPSIAMSHIFYADDVFLFGTASVHNASCMMETLQEFGKLSGLFINNLKSSIIFPPSLPHTLRNDISNRINVSHITFFGRYLGVNISPHKQRKQDYLDLVQKTKDKISGWQAKQI